MRMYLYGMIWLMVINIYKYTNHPLCLIINGYKWYHPNFGASSDFGDGLWQPGCITYNVGKTKPHTIPQSSPFLKVVCLPFQIMGGLWHCFTNIKWYHLSHNDAKNCFCDCHDQRKLGSNLPSYGQLALWDYTQWRGVCEFTLHKNETCETILNEWWCESLHGVVRVDITSRWEVRDYTQWMVVCELTLWLKIAV